MLGLFSTLVERFRISGKHFKFYISRKISYPLVPPDILQLCFLFRCNLRCKMCSIKKRSEIVKQSGLSCELSFEAIKNLILQAEKMRIKQLLLVGGEPFLSKDIFNIINFAYSHNMMTAVVTNGTLLDNEGIIHEILNSKLQDLVISIDGATDNTYKAIRGEGIFAVIKDNIKLLNRIKRERKLFLPGIVVSCTIMDSNIEELINIVYLAKELGAIGVSFQPMVVDNTDQRARDSANPYWVPQSRYHILDQSIDKLVKYKLSCRDNFILTNLNQLKLIKKYFRQTLHKQRCYAGLNRIIISQDGKMYFCAAEPIKGEISFGDVHKDRLKDLWYSTQARIFRKSVKTCDKPCLQGCTRRHEFDNFLDGFYFELFHEPITRLRQRFAGKIKIKESFR